MRRAARAALLVGILPLGLATCGPENPELLPDQVLRDSLGLGDDDRVWTTSIRTGAAGAEIVEPGELSVRPGGWVEFISRDARVHTVRFDLDAMPAAQADWLRATGQASSPPMLRPETRFLVRFQDAPEGVYPFVVEGGGPAASGTVVVRTAER